MKGKWEQVAAKSFNGSIYFQIFVDGAFPMTMPAVVEPNLSVRIPSGMPDPFTKIKGSPGHGVSLHPLTCIANFLLPLCDFVRQFDTQSFISINAQNPIVAGVIRREILLWRIAFPRTGDYARAAMAAIAQVRSVLPESTTMISSQQARLDSASAMRSSSFNVMIVAVIPGIARTPSPML